MTACARHYFYFNKQQTIISFCFSIYVHRHQFIPVNKPCTPYTEFRITSQRISAYNYALRGILFRGQRKIFYLHFFSLFCVHKYSCIWNTRTRLHVSGLHWAYLQSLRNSRVRKTCISLTFFQSRLIEKLFKYSQISF